MDTALFPSEPFDPSDAALRARLAAVRPGDYARTRNHLQGAVTRLSPYLAHGFTTLPEVLAAVRAHQPVDTQHKLVYELGWRAYFQHVWRHEGDAIFESLHAGPLPEAAYARTLPEDIRHGATGVPVIDRAVRELYATGYLHNHARMWLASYVVHLRKVHWRAGADWLYGHLLDGDLASNHLSWQWVAGTGSHKPYLFNAENVARHAPPDWHSPGTPVDTSYEALERIAHGPRAVPVAGGAPVDEPPLLHEPPAALAERLALHDAAPPPEGAWLLHPWALRAAPAAFSQRPVLGVFAAAFHRRWPWSERRWRFVGERMAQLAPRALWLPARAPAGSAAFADLHLHGQLSGCVAQPVPALFAEPGRRCGSFSQFWHRTGHSADHAPH
jgi:deoxyribodipyrimidine photo-lyase